MIEKEAHAINEARGKHDAEKNASWLTTRSERYPRSIGELAKLLEKKGRDKLVIHFIGVGEEGGPQLKEVISALKNHTDGDVEVHVMDRNQFVLDDAVDEAKRLHPSVDIISHNLDIIAPDHAPITKSDLTICTNVLCYADGVNKDVGLYNIASFMKKGGYLLVSPKDMKTKLPATEFGLKELKIVEEAQQYRFDIRKKFRENSMILQKVGHSGPFSDLWEKLQVQK